MMANSRITAKGQATIPKKVRAKKACEVFGAFSHKTRGPLTTAQIERRLEKAFCEGWQG